MYYTMTQNQAERLKVLYRYIPGKKLLALCIRAFISPKGIDKILRFWGWFSFTVPKKGVALKEIKMFNYCSDIESQIFWYGLAEGWEKNEIHEWVRYVGDASIIIDIGANTGVYALIAKTLNPQAHVYAFEPVDRIFAKLSKNVNRNNLDIKLEKLAISNATGDAFIYDPLYENVTSVTVNMNLAPEQETYTKVPIKIITLDDYCEQEKIDRIDLIKIDVESHEPEVLAGYTKLQQHRPVILCEVWNDEIGSRLEEYIPRESYHYYFIDELHGGLKETSSIKVPMEITYCNFLFVPKSRTS